MRIPLVCSCIGFIKGEFPQTSYKSLNSVVHWFVPPLFLHLYYSTEKPFFQFIFYMNFILNFYSKGRTSSPLFQTLFTKNEICDIMVLLARASRLLENSTNFSCCFLSNIHANKKSHELAYPLYRRHHFRGIFY